MKKLGFGCMRLPLKEGGDKSKIDLKQLKQMVDEFISAGFTYFDTAYFYHNGKSESALNKALVKRYPRNAYTITDKLPVYLVKNEKSNERIFQMQLRRLGVDYVDYYLMHAINMQRYESVKDKGTFEFMQRIKKEGRAKHIGFSYHDNAKNLDIILSQIGKWVEFVQLQVNYLDWNSYNVEAKKCMEVCKKYKKKVIIMEPIKGGRLANLSDENNTIFHKLNPNASPASFAVRFCASLDNVYMVLSGMSNLDQCRDNISYMKHFKPLNDKETKAIHKVVKNILKEKKIDCTGCAYCTNDCPSKINIPELFKLYNNPYHSNAEFREITKEGGKPSDCKECGLCEQNCPQGLKIKDYLKDCKKEFE